MFGAGRYRDRVTVERQTEEIDEAGNVGQAWSTLATVWADMLERTGAEKLQAGALEAPRLATIRVRQSSVTSGITAKDRVLARGETWNIRSIAQIGRKNDELEMSCETGVAT